MVASKPNITLKSKFIIIGITLLALSICIVIVGYYNNKKTEKLQQDGFITTAIVEMLEEDVSQGKSQMKDYVHFYFIQNDTVIHDVEMLNWIGIEHHAIKVGACFEIMVSASDYSNFNIDFSKRCNSPIINPARFKTHIYN